MFHPKKVLTVLGISTLLLSPAMPSFQLTGADAAFAAKGGNDNGGGNGGGKGGNNGGGNNGGGGNAKSPDTKSSSGKPSPAAGKKPSGSETPAKAGGSSLGNMNSALRANPKALLAHIRNGNTQGPIGRLAAYVVAKSKAAGIDPAVVAQQQAAYNQWQTEFTAALETGNYEDVDDYIQAKQAAADLKSEYDLAKADYDQWVEDGQPDPALTEPTPPQEFQTVAILETPAPPEPSQTDAETLAAVTEAESRLLASWNKNPDTDPATVSPQERALLDSLLARFSPEQLATLAAAAG